MTDEHTVREARSVLILAESNGDVAALFAGLDADDDSLRALALGGLERLDALDDTALDNALADPSRDVRCRALEIAIAHHSVEVLHLLDDLDDLVVETAAFVLGERETVTDEIIARLSHVARAHEISICREAAIAALGALGDEAGLPAILGGLDDRPPVRRRAVLALAPFDTPEVTQALQRATGDRDRQVRQAAEDLL